VTIVDFRQRRSVAVVPMKCCENVEGVQANRCGNVVRRSQEKTRIIFDLTNAHE
jgi:hypothetical protein